MMLPSMKEIIIVATVNIGCSIKIGLLFAKTRIISKLKFAVIFPFNKIVSKLAKYTSAGENNITPNTFFIAL